MKVNTDIIEPELASRAAQAAYDAITAELPFSQILPDHAVDDLPDGMTGENTTVSWVPNQRSEISEDTVFRAWDGEVPYGKTTGSSVIKRAALQPIGAKMRISEYDIVSLRANATSEERIENLLGKMGVQTALKVEKARIDAVVNAKLVINENGVANTLDYARDTTLAAAAPAAKWNMETADPYADIETWCDLIQDADGALPTTMVVTRNVMRTLMANPNIIKRRYGQVTATVTPPSVRRDEVESVFSNVGIDNIIVIDELYSKFFADQRLKEQKGIYPANTVLLLPGIGDTGIGATVHGETAEASLGIIPDGYGLFGGVGDADGTAPAYDVYATGNFLPVLAQPDSTLAVTVL